MSEIEIIELRDKVLKGVDIAFERLVERKRRDGGKFVFADEEGNVIRVPAHEVQVRKDI
ncbi:MAG: histidine kinase [Rikenellaceae bacterium]|nr:histidine kinase [Rikenellaceae bacterium]